jgi:hypothetical protein
MMMALPTALLTLLATSIVSAQRVVLADIWKPQVAPNGTILGANETIARRSFSLGLGQKPDRTLYWINITMGTPGQKQALQLDTGSAQLLVPATGSSLCSSSLIPCSVLGSFDSSQSSTFSDTGQSTTASFTDGATVSGNWVYDTVNVGGQSVTSQLAVLGTSGRSITEGVLGVGFPASYPTLNHNLKAQGIIASNSYSLWLDSLDSTSGTILFGGINLSRFVGTLIKIPVIGTANSDGTTSYNQATVHMTRVSTVSGLLGLGTTVQTASNYVENAILDTGTTVTILQQDLATKIINAMGAQYYPSGSTSGNAIIPCSAADNPNGLSVNFHFSNLITGPTINVDLSQLVLTDLGSMNGVEYCQFGIYSAAPSDNYPTILGDTFLRSAYVVYDLDHHKVGLAQTSLSNAAANIVEISAAGITVGVST